MKTNLICRIGLMVSIILSVIACSEESDSISVVSQKSFKVYMAVTNEAGKDLIFQSSGYTTDNNGTESFEFDTWNVAMDGETLPISSGTGPYARKDVITFIQQQRYVCLNTSENIKNKLEEGKGYAQAHTLDYVVTSASLFGDEKPHTIRIDFTCQPNSLGTGLAFSNYILSVDGTSQEVVFPTSWEVRNAQATDSHLDCPYFVLRLN